MNAKPKVLFIHWYEPDDFHHWNDGLAAALKLLEEHYAISYKDSGRFMQDYASADPYDVSGFDIVMGWGGSTSREAEFLKKVDHPRKVLLYAGGELHPDVFEDIHHVVLETPTDTIDGISTSYAFGTNTKFFTPKKTPKIWDGFLPAAYAAWKRQQLFADALGDKGLLCGPKQEVETECFEYPEEMGVLTLPNMNQEVLPYLYSASYALVNTATQWGGCQRSILESMACGVPAIVMGDSKRNAWYIEDSGIGFVVDPDPNSIRAAIEKVKATQWETRRYVMSKWTERHYAENLRSVLESV